MGLELKKQYYRGRTYIAASATNGAMVKPGQITEVYYLEGEGADEAGRVNMYWSDGWSWGHLGRWEPKEIFDLGLQILQKPNSEGEDIFMVYLFLKEFYRKD